MNNEQLYKRQNGNYKEVYPNTLLSSILDKESGKSLKDIISAYNHLYVPFINNIYETLTAIPVYIRRKGLWVTWETEDGIKTYQFELSTAEAANDAIWGNIESWTQIPDLDYYEHHAAVPDGSITLDKLSEELRDWLVNAGKIVNNPDNESISEEHGVLKIANRPYNFNTNSMGYKILSRDKSFAEQVIEENTIYEIRYNFTLDENVIIPNNCVLKFNGGSISGAYTITGNNTSINAGLVKIFNTDVILAETWNITESYPEWFGAKGDKITDDTSALEVIINSKINKKVIFSKIYYTSRPIKIPTNVNIEGYYGHNYDKCGIRALSSFSSIAVENETASGIFWARYSTGVCITGISIDCNGVADYGIQALKYNGTGWVNQNVKLEDCYICKAVKAGILTYGCEKYIINNVLVEYCNFGIVFSQYEVTISEIGTITTGAQLAQPNMIDINSSRFLLNNIGIYINGSSNVSMKSCSFGYNFMFAECLYSCYNVSFVDLYTEGDAVCHNYIQNGNIAISSAAMGVAAQYLIDNNKDGINAKYGRTTYYLRAPFLFINSTVNILGMFASLKARSTSNTNPSSYDLPSVRTSGGVDSLILLRGTTLNGFGVRTYVLNNNYGVLPFSEILEFNSSNLYTLSNISYDTTSRGKGCIYRLFSNVNITPATLTADKIRILDFHSNHNINLNTKNRLFDSGKSWNLLNKPPKEIYNNVPLFTNRNLSKSRLYLTRQELKDLCGTYYNQVRFYGVVKLLSPLTSVLSVVVNYLKNDSGIYAVTVYADSYTFNAGYYIFDAIISEDIIDDYDDVIIEISSNLSDLPSDSLLSNYYFYRIEDNDYKISNPKPILTVSSNPTNLSNNDIGGSVWNETLGKPVYWTGTTWVDATGTQV